MKQYQQAAALLPVSLRRLALAADRSIQTRAEEIRLRSGQRLSALLPEGETVLSEKAVEQEQKILVLVFRAAWTSSPITAS